MQKFLEEVARQVIEDYGSNLSCHRLIFPNRRSALYFRSYLSKMVTKPLLAPKIETVNEFFRSMSGLNVADPLQLIFRLYESYKKIKGKVEPFDEFYFWGEMIVNDFDDIDKYLVDHTIIFQNLKDLRDIDAKFGGLDRDIVEIIREFWTGFDPSNITSEKADFLAVWDILIPLYTEFKYSLRESGLAYEGMIMRDSIESLSSDNNYFDNPVERFHIIGFNALTGCEREVFKYLRKRQRASFYWDYDMLYFAHEDHEAGLFIRDNINVYGQDLRSLLRFDNLIIPEQPEGKWEVYKAPSDVAQAKLLPELLQGFGKIDHDPNNTAIILADENMLMPVMNSLPEDVDEVNITMGYPLYQTPVYSLVHQLLSLQNNRRRYEDSYSFYYTDVMKLLNHQYITYRYGEECDEVSRNIRDQNMIRVSRDDLTGGEFFDILFSDAETYADLNLYLIDVLQEILLGFASVSDPDDQDSSGTGYDLQREYLYILITSLKQLGSTMSSTDLSLGPDIYSRIADRIIRKLIVPFSGEPLRGLQVMGILETRAIDFENIVFLSVNEGVIPKGSAGNSYIPYNLRMAFRLPTVKHQDSIFAYYFYRLVQRAKRVRFIYNSSASGIHTGEMSRFLLQLKYNQNLSVKFIDSKFSIVPPPVVGDVIKRDNQIHSLILDTYNAGRSGRPLSPSALNTWINCRMRFYYRYIKGITEQEEVSEEVDSPMFGTILHEVMNKLYSKYAGEEIQKGELEGMLSSDYLTGNVVRVVFRELFMRGKRGKITGKNLIITSVIENMVRQILKVDLKLAPFSILELEQTYNSTLILPGDVNKREIILGGIIDRIDSLNGVVRILDYKSGRDSLEIDTLESLTQYNVSNRNSAAFQTFVYSLLYSDSRSIAKLRPALYPVRAIFEENFSDTFRIKRGQHIGDVADFKRIAIDFKTGLYSVLNDIFDPGFDFDMTTVKENCRYCPFNKLCDRQDVK